MLVAQSCPTLCDPMDCSPPGSSVHEIFQARILEGLPFPSPGDLPNSGIEPRSPALQANSLLTELQGKPIHKFRRRKSRNNKSPESTKQKASLSQEKFIMANNNNKAHTHTQRYPLLYNLR